MSGFFSKSRLSLLSLIVPIALLVLWEWSIDTHHIPNTILASPSQVAKDFIIFLRNGSLFVHCAASLRRLVLGYLIGTVLGLFLGASVGVSKLTQRLISPTIQFLVPIPPIAWIPLLIILLGIGEVSKVALVALASFFTLYFNTVQGFRATDQKLVDVANVYKKSNLELVFKVLFPSAMPQIFAGLRSALALSWILLIAAEVIASSKGLGWLIWDARNFSRPDDMIVGIITIGILGKLSDSALVALENRVVRWRYVFTGK